MVTLVTLIYLKIYKYRENKRIYAYILYKLYNHVYIKSEKVTKVTTVFIRRFKCAGKSITSLSNSGLSMVSKRDINVQRFLYKVGNFDLKKVTLKSRIGNFGNFGNF